MCITEQIKQKVVFIRGMKRDLEEMESAVDEEEVYLEELLYKWLKENNKLTGDLKDIKSYDIQLGSWDCENSPTEKCVLHYDFCLICGEPDERK